MYGALVPVGAMAEPSKTRRAASAISLILPKIFPASRKHSRMSAEFDRLAQASSARLIDDVVKLRGVDIAGTTSLDWVPASRRIWTKRGDRLQGQTRGARDPGRAHGAQRIVVNTATNGGRKLSSIGAPGRGCETGNNNTSYATVYVVDTGRWKRGDLGFGGRTGVLRESTRWVLSPRHARNTRHRGASEQLGG